MRILVTGGAGFIGSNVADRFLELGHEVAVFDDLSTGFQEFLDARCCATRTCTGRGRTRTARPA